MAVGTDSALLSVAMRKWLWHKDRDAVTYSYGVLRDSVIAVTAHSPFGETERSAGRWLPYLRLLAAIALAGLAILALQLGAVGQNLNDGIAVLARNVIGFTGLGAAVLAGHRRPARLDAPDLIHDVLPVRPAGSLDRPVDLAGPPARRPRRLDLRLRGLRGRPAAGHHPWPRTRLSDDS